MTVKELIARFRVLANDKAEPYFWADEEIIYWLDDAQQEAAIRGRLINEQHDAEMCVVAVEAGRAAYEHHKLMYEFDYAAFDGGNGRNCLYLISVEEMNRLMPQWRTASGEPKYALQDDTRIILSPVPDVAGTLYLGGYRLPKPLLSADDEPEINRAHHRHLLQWVLYQAFGIPDTEMFDPNRAQESKYNFERYFGLQTDSDLRRITREDVPHTTKPFWV